MPAAVHVGAHRPHALPGTDLISAAAPAQLRPSLSSTKKELPPPHAFRRGATNEFVVQDFELGEIEVCHACMHRTWPSPVATSDSAALKAFHCLPQARHALHRLLQPSAVWPPHCNLLKLQQPTPSPSPQAVTIGHDGSGQRPAWHLQEVRVANTGSGQEWRFPCRQWFDARSGDGRTERRLAAGRWVRRE